MTTNLITPEEVYGLAYANVSEYTPVEVITENDITVAERRYLIPVVGDELYASLLAGSYSSLLDDYVAPALALFVREVIDAPSAPASKAGLRRARTMLKRLSDHLDDNSSSYAEYDEDTNILKRCRIHGGDIQIR